MEEPGAGVAGAMYEFLNNNRDELIERCKVKVARRQRRAATPEQLKNGLPLFLHQLTKTLEAEKEGHPGDSLRISGASGGSSDAPSGIGRTATAHGKQLLELRYTVDQVVHDYGDLCQAITDLAVERDAPFSVDEFRTLNRCLDNAIADAVTAFSAQRDATVLRRYTAEANERLGFLVHELRNSLQTATLALAALEAGQLPISGATGGVLRRSLTGLTKLVDRALDDVRACAEPPPDTEVFSLASFPADAGNAAALRADARDCRFSVKNVDPRIESRETGSSCSAPWPTCCRTRSSSPGRTRRFRSARTPGTTARCSSTSRTTAAGSRQGAPKSCSGRLPSATRTAAGWGSGCPSPGRTCRPPGAPWTCATFPAADACSPSACAGTPRMPRDNGRGEAHARPPCGPQGDF